MAYSVVADIKVITGWSGDADEDISDTDITSLIVLADAYIDSIGFSGGSNILKLASVYLTAHMGTMRIEGNIQSYGGVETVSVTFKHPTAYLEEFRRIIASAGSSLRGFKKVEVSY